MARTDTLLLVVKYIIAHSSWSNTIELHAADLPESFQLTKAVLVIPDGGYSNLSLPVSQEMFTFWCYGTTPQEARTVVDTIQTIFTRTKPAAVTMPSGTGYFLTARRLFGPVFHREPDTTWPRWSVSFDMTLADVED